MAETFYKSDGPRQIEVKEYDSSKKRGPIHYYEGGKHISGDAFLDYMKDNMEGNEQSREEYLKEHAEEAREWARREREGSLINENGRLLTPEGELMFPTRREKAGKVAGKAATAARNGVDRARSAREERDRRRTERDERVREVFSRRPGPEEKLEPTLVMPGVSAEEESVATTPEETGEMGESKTGAATIKTKGGDLEGEVLGPSKKYPDGKRPETGELYYEVRVKIHGKDVVWDNVNAKNVEFKDEPASSAPESSPKTNPERRKFLEKVLRIHEEVEKRFKKAQKEQTFLDLSDPSLNSAAREQIKKQVIDENLADIPDDQKEQARSDIESALKDGPEKLTRERDTLRNAEVGGVTGEIGNKLGDPGEMEIRGQDKDGNPFIYRKKDGKWYVSRNGNLAKEWFESTPEGMQQDIGLNLMSGETPDTKPEERGEDDETVDVERMEASMARLKTYNQQLKEALDAGDYEKAKEIQGQIDEELENQRKVWGGEVEETAETVAMSDETAKEIAEQRRKSLWRRAVDRFRRGFRRGKDDMTPGPLVAEDESTNGGAPSRVVEVEETREKRERDRRGLVGFAAGALAVGGTALITWALMRQGHPQEVIQQFIMGKNNFINNGHDMFVNITGHAHEHAKHAIDFSNLNPNTIHAHTPLEFHKGVLHLLHQQGVPVHELTPDRIKHMNHFMEAHQIASGMKDGAHGLEQNLTSFPHVGQEFANTHASAEQGFRLGADGSGRAALIQYAREAQRIGLIG